MAAVGRQTAGNLSLYEPKTIEFAEMSVAKKARE
jgi:hypothetical protein